MGSKRDGRSLTDLALFCDEMQAHIRRLTKSLKAEAADRETARTKAHSSTIQRSMRSLSSALQELVSVMPRVPSLHPSEAALDSRVLAMGLITQWLDRDGEIAEKARRGIHGHSDTMELGSVVEIIATQRKSGLLRVRGQAETILLEFDEGDVVHAVSDNAPICDRLGEILVEQGALDRDTLKALLSKYADSRQKLGTHHEIQKLVGEEGLRAALEEQVQRLFNRLFAMSDAYFEFIEDAAKQHLQKVRLAAMSLLLESAHVLDTTREQSSMLSGSFDMDDIFNDEDARVQIAASAARASGVHSAIDAMLADSEDIPLSGAIGIDEAEGAEAGEDASEDERHAGEPAAETDAESGASEDGHDDQDEGDDDDGAGSFLRRYGIGTRSWLSEKHGFAHDAADDGRVSSSRREALGRSPGERSGSRPRPRRR